MCNVNFNGPKTLRTHLLSRKHAAVVETARAEDSSFQDEAEAVLDRLYSLFPDMQEQLEPSLEAMKDVQANPNLIVGPNAYRCFPCNQFFNGPVPFNMHIRSAKHLKRVSTEEYVCKICDKTFNGPSPLNMHLQGTKHKIAAGILPVSAGSKKPVRKASGDEADSVLVRCEVCNLQCNSRPQLSSHYRGRLHRERLLAMTLDEQTSQREIEAQLLAKFSPHSSKGRKEKKKKAKPFNFSVTAKPFVPSTFSSSSSSLMSDSSMLTVSSTASSPSASPAASSAVSPSESPSLSPTASPSRSP